MKFNEFVFFIEYPTLGNYKGKKGGRGSILNSRCNLLLIPCVYYIVVKRFFGS